MSLPPKIWTKLDGKYSDGFACTWQGLHAVVLQSHQTPGPYALTVQTERAFVERRMVRGPSQLTPVPYLVQNIRFKDSHAAITAAESILDAIMPPDVQCCPTCGREKL